jgi:GNAT superfamily N-acetyltransferase
MDEGARSGIRAARRGDLQTLTDLRMRYLGEAAHQDARLRLLPDARARTEQTLPVWMGQDDRILLVALSGPDEDDEPVGYAMGLLTMAPPLLQVQQVGEILEVYLAPDQRGRGLGAALVGTLTEVLVGRGARVLRAAIPVANARARAQLEAAGYVPLQLELERALDAG